MYHTTKRHLEQYSLNWFKKQILNVLKQGPVPKHIGFIMDGNRRYAKKMNMESIKGHLMGFEKAMETIIWWKHLEVTNCTIYMFSIENFKRTKQEVDNIIEMAIDKYKNILENIDEFIENKICIRIIGNFSLIPTDLRKLMCEVYLKTKHNNLFFINVAFAYTSRDEITNTVKLISHANTNKEILKKDVDIDLFNNLLYTGGIPKMDMLIRTSGEVRLSDFMQWQARNTEIFFVKAFWPEMSLWDIIYCIFQYQRHLAEFEKVQEMIQCSPTIYNKSSDRIECFIQKHRENKLSEIKMYAGLP